MCQNSKGTFSVGLNTKMEKKLFKGHIDARLDAAHRNTSH